LRHVLRELDDVLRVEIAVGIGRGHVPARLCERQGARQPERDGDQLLVAHGETLEDGAEEFSSPATCAAMASDAVRPGDSIPNRFTSPGTPCSRGPSIRKSRAGSSGDSWIFGRIPE